MGFTIQCARLLLPALALASLRDKQGSALNLEMFQVLDKDNSGFIEQHEGLEGFDSWQPYDTNQDGKLHLKEFSALGHAAQRLETASILQEKAKKTKSSARARCLPGSPKDIFMFELADKDKSGFVEENEGMSKFDWKVFDNDKDGKLSPKEFMIMVQDSLRLEDEGPELSDEDRPKGQFSASIHRHGASFAQAGAGMMRGRDADNFSPEDKNKARNALKAAGINPAGLDQKVKKGTQPGGLPHAPNEQLPPELSAFEADHWNDASEYFGPFRIDYSVHNIELPGWNFVIESPSETPGRGNVIVGDQNFVSDADNTFVVGKHHTARGRQISIVGGKDNVAEGVGITIVGGEQNAARGNYTVLDGGYRNEANGNYAVVEGGVKNVAAGEFATISGGQSGIATGYAASLTGGKANEATGKHSAVHGGSGNKARGELTTIDGGVGQSAEVEGESVYMKLTKEDQEIVQDPDHVGQHFT